MANTTTTLLLPMQLTAFVLNEQCCNSKNFKIAPLTQPNYTFLRLHENLLTSDVLDHVDVHTASPSKLNSRVYNLGTGVLRQERLGVYLHWTLPQVYRSGMAAVGPDASQKQADSKLQQGYPSPPTLQPGASPPKPDYSMPDFRPVPNRWLVTRRITSKTPANAAIDEYHAWVVESDTITNINSMEDSRDIENEFAPFTNTSIKDLQAQSAVLIDGQAEIFVGKKSDLASWRKDSGVSQHVDLNVMASSNPLFADYTHHNMNVFTISDNFKCNDGQFLTAATADYSVVGWHSTSDADPMTTSATVKADKMPLNAERLTSCMMQMKDGSPDFVQAWLKANTAIQPSRTLCHGTMYQVKYDSGQLPLTVTAETSGRKMKKAQPIAVGTSSTDAILAFCRAHLKDDLSDKTMHDFEQDLLGLATLLLNAEGDDVEGFRAAADENFKQAFTKIEAGIKWVLKQQSDPGQKPYAPGIQQINDLLTLNSIQQTRDTATRELADLRWSLFAMWWDFISSFGDNADPGKYSQSLVDVKVKLDGLSKRISKVQTDLDKQKATVNNNLPGKLAKKQNQDSDWLTQAAAEYFYQRKDPTILFSDVGHGWDPDFEDDSEVRVHQTTAVSQIVKSGNLDPSFSGYLKSLEKQAPDTNSIPGELIDGIKALLGEFYKLKNDYASLQEKLPSQPTPSKDQPQPIQIGKGEVLPYFHSVNQGQAGRDFWNWTQPFKPLMIEWEAIYYHVPMQYWDFKLHNNLSHWGDTTVHYGINTEISKIPTITNDRRHISGRNILLPQASSALAITLKTIFENTSDQDLIANFAKSHPEIDLSKMTAEQQTVWLKAEQKELLATVASLEMTSAPMTGFTSHLLTLHEGSHVKPFLRVPNNAPQPIDAAVTGLSKALGGDKVLSRGMIEAMQSETALTPYGGSVQPESKDISPFKPVTHGQLIFTKVNLIDKFGQVLSAIDPRPQRRGAALQPMIPCLADTYYPGTVGDTNPSDPAARPNTITKQTSSACPFILLPPAINQPSRINASFVQKVDGAWRRCSEWDDPVWGWLVVNYADAGLQVFFPDGTFYQEIRLGGKFGTSAGQKFLPFDRPVLDASMPKQFADAAKRDVTQLDFLIQRLADPTSPSYFQGMIDMILQSLDDKQAHAPKSYATHASAVVGKPLALVNAGWSLELSSAEYSNWSTVNSKPAERTLLDGGTLLADGVFPDKIAIDAVKNNAGRALNPGDKNGYTFPIKLGDAERSFDGLVGYFPLNTANTPLKPGQVKPDLDFGTLYTYFDDDLQSPGPKNKDPRVSLITSTGADKSSILTPLQLTPYHLNSYVEPNDLKFHDAQLKVFGLLIDPFMPVHAYSSILPNKALKLPSWPVEQALNRMTAFWKAGPLLVTQDVPRQFTEDWSVNASDYGAKIAPGGATAAKIPLVSLPLAPPVGSSSGASSAYRWLQPYWTDMQPPVAMPPGALHPTPGTPPGPKPFKTRFTAMGISDDSASAADAATLRLEKGPYTAVEGFIQVAKPLGTTSGQVVAG